MVLDTGVMLCYNSDYKILMEGTSVLSERLEIQIKMFESVKGGVISEIDGYRQTIESSVLAGVGPQQRQSSHGTATLR